MKIQAAVAWEAGATLSFSRLNEAIADSLSGATVKPVLTFDS